MEPVDPLEDVSVVLPEVWVNQFSALYYSNRSQVFIVNIVKLLHHFLLGSTKRINIWFETEKSITRTPNFSMSCYDFYTFKCGIDLLLDFIADRSYAQKHMQNHILVTILVPVQFT